LWLESTFHNSQPLNKKQDCLVTFVHWKLLSNGYLVLHSKQVRALTPIESTFKVS
jgi:hypothetical protein